MNDTSLQAIRHPESFSSLLVYELNRIIFWKVGGGRRLFTVIKWCFLFLVQYFFFLKAFINSKRHDELYIHTFA